MTTGCQSSIDPLSHSDGQAQLLHEDSDESMKSLRNLLLEEPKTYGVFKERLVRYAKADSRQFAEMMLAKLPKEVRDMVYQYLYIADTSILIGSHHFATYVDPLNTASKPPVLDRPSIVIPEGAVVEDHSTEPPSSIISPNNRLLDPAYLGHRVAVEASKFYYSFNAFSICTFDYALSSFLLTDPAQWFGPKGSQVQPFNLRPIDHVRTLQVRVKYEHYDENLEYYESRPDRESDIINDIFANLKPLEALPAVADATALEVELLLITAFNQANASDHREDINRRYTNLLEAIRHPLYTLKHDIGALITLSHHDETKSPFPRDITELFTLTKEQWQYEKSALEAAKKVYSPLQYFSAAVDSPSQTSTTNTDFNELADISRQRWGVDELIEARRCTYPIEESVWWPMRRPSRAQHVDART